MANERYFAGNTLAAFARTSTAIVETTTAGRFDSSYVANSIGLTGTTQGVDYIETYPFIDAASTTTLWLRFDIFYSGPGSSVKHIEFLNSSGVVVARFVTDGSGNPAFSYWNGSTFTALGSGITYGVSALKTVTMKLTAGVSGTIDVWLGGVSILSQSGMNAAVTNFAKVRLYTAGSQYNLSQIAGANFDLRDFHYAQQLANGNGADTDGTGSYTDINETVLDDSTSVNLPAVSNAKTFTKPSLTVPGGYSIDSMWVAARARVSGGTVTDGDLLIRSGGSDYASSGRSFSGGYEPRGHNLAQDPATAATWTQAGYNNAEFGLKAA